MGVGRDHRIQRENFFLPEKGADHAFAQIKGRIRRPAPVHQQVFSAGKFNQDGAAVPHIQESESQGAKS